MYTFLTLFAKQRKWASPLRCVTIGDEQKSYVRRAWSGSRPISENSDNMTS